eukprot:GHUV01006450.1.p1 GENE.GHUV01006450.1~~GHUV01006450.1.p1  ORF type:complete len:677 (+),score=272.17 GHUV01006450.1:324-2354(+)
MFYSHDLLGRKTPLGAIWTLAHGRKLSKGKIISINLREICQEILQPGVPHSLRLQGILIGGVVIVYNKQQSYLLEDLQDMMRRVKAAGKVAAPEGTAAATTAGRNTLKKDKNQARLEAITLMDMEDLLAPTADLGVGDDFLGLLDGGYSGMTGSDASRGAKRRRRDGAEDEEVADGLFIMPSMPSDRTLSKETSRSRSVSWATGLQDQPQQEQEVYGGLTQQHDLNQWNPNDEFFDLNTDLDLLGGMDLPIATAADVPRPANSAATGTTRNTRPTATMTTTSNLDQENPYDPTLLPDTEHQQDLMDLDQQPYEQGTLGLHQAEAALSDSQVVAEEGRVDDTAAQQDVDRQQQEEDQGARKAMARKQRKRKLGQAFVDDLDNLQIKSREYREWVTDHSALINRDRKQGQALAQTLPGLTANTTLNNMLAVNPQALLDPSALMSYPAALFGGLGAAGASALGNLQLAPELLDLFKAPVLAANTAGGKGKRIPEPSSPEVNNSTGDGVLPGNLHGGVHRDQLAMRRVPGQHEHDLDDEVQGRYHNMTLPDNFEMQDEDEMHPHHGVDLPAGMDLPEGAELLDEEAHDRLMNLPSEGEIERLRAGRPSSTHSGSLHLSSPGGTERHTDQRSGKTDTTDDSMRQARPYEGPELSEGAVGLNRALRMNSQDLEGAVRTLRFA